jgi:hypothetical protein
VTVDEVAQATNTDKDLTLLRKLLTSGAKYLPKTLNAYKRMVPELSVSREGIVLRGHRILLPKTLRSRVIDLAHAGHQGMVKTKRLIRSRVWFEGIDNAVESKVKKCKECQATTDKPAYEPLKPSTMPEAPWHTGERRKATHTCMYAFACNSLVYLQVAFKQSALMQTACTTAL